MEYPTVEALFKTILQDFEHAADEQTAAGMAKYMRNQFAFFGIKSPMRKGLTARYKSALRALPPDKQLTLSKLLWNEPQRELQYLTVDLLTLVAMKPAEQHMALYVYLITTKSWWDTVDAIAANLVGPYFTKFPEIRDQAIDNWMNSGNMWLQRTCLLFQLKYKDKTDEQFLYSLIEKLCHKDEFFIKKAIGWSLRQYGKTNPAEVRTFVARTALKPLSKKEALKNL